MTQQLIDIGVQGNDGTGDSIRESFRKVNENFNEIYSVFGLGGTIRFTDLGDTPNSYTANQVIMSDTTGTTLTARDLVAGAGIAINKTSNTTVTITSTTTGLIGDNAPSLGLNLNANNFTIARLANPSQTLVDAFNASYASLGVSTTLAQLAINKGYADNNYVAVSNGYITNALKSRDEPAIPETNDPDYDKTLSSNYLSTEVMQRKDTVYRGGDTMTGALTLNDHPAPLTGFGTPNGATDLQAATKYYVDNNSFSSNVNLYVSAASGDDQQTKSPEGKEGRFWQYAYKTVGQAALAAENLINLASLEPGPYKQKIAYTVGVNQSFSTIQSVTLNGGNSGVSGYEHASQLLSLNKGFIQSETIAYLNKKYVNYIPIDNARYSAIIGNIVDGISYDLVLNTNYNSITQASRLFNPTNIDLVTEQLTQLIDGIEYAKSTILAYSYSTVNAQNYIGAVIDAICYDLVFQGSFQSIQVALAFEQYNTGLDLDEIKATLLNLRTTLTAIASVAVSPNAVSSITNNITLINNLLTTGNIPTVSFPAIQTTAAGRISARELLLDNIPFIQAEISAYLKANFPTVIYNVANKQRDVEYIIWSLVYDLMYGGNQQSVYTGLQYWKGGVYQLLASEKEAYVSAIGYINTLAQAVIINTAPATVYQTSFRQYTNETITGGAVASSSISTNIASIVSIVNAVSLPTPTVVDPTISSVSSVLLTARTNILAQKSALKTAATTYINSNTSFSVINNDIINGIITTNFATITNILTLGISTRSVPTYVSPSGLSTGFTYARQALLANINFLVEETYYWQLVQTPTFVPSEGVASFKRRLGYFLEAVAYDITYGGNSGSLPNGYEYWVNGVSTLSNSERAIYVQSISRLQNIASLVSSNSVVSPTFQSNVSQTFNILWAGGSAAQSTVNERFSNISTIVQNNTSLVYVYPNLDAYDSVYRAARTTIINNRLSISTGVVNYLTAKYKGGFNYNESTCYRDLGYIIEGMRIDLLTGGNYQTVTAGKSYYKSASARLAITTQLTETIDGITFARNLALQVLNQTSATRFQTLVTQVFNGSLTASTLAKTTLTNNMNTILSIITNGYGSAPAASFGTGIYTVVFGNGGNGYVDQGSPGSVHIIPAKILVGSTSGAAGSIVKYHPGAGPSADAIQLRLTRPGFFQVGEEMEFGETVKDLNITIFVESGIYQEDYPIRLPAQCSIKGDEFRRTIIRPLDRVSQSPWRKIFFYRDAVIDGLQIGLTNTSVDYAPQASISLGGTTNKIVITLGSGQAQANWIGKIIQDNNIPAGKAVIETVAGNTMNCGVIYPFAAKTTYTSGNWHIYGTYNYGRHYLTNPLDITSNAKNNRDIDVLLCGDATRVSNITFQGHGGFAMVLDPEGQIKTKSPYGQVCTSFSQSVNKQAFRGGQFVDGFAGRLFGTITGVADAGITVTVTGSVNSGLDIRPPQAPCVFYVQGNRFQVNDVVSFDPATYTVVLTLDVSTPFNTVNIYNTANFSTEVGLRIDELTTDLVLGSNFQSIKAGLYYLQTARVLVGIQQIYRLAGLNKTRELMNAAISNGVSRNIITSQMTTITDMVTNGFASLPTATFPEPAGVTANVSRAKNILIANKQFIRDELVAWVAQNFATRGYPGYNAFALSQRIGYLIDAMTYDLLYGGNSSTRDIAQLYYANNISQIQGLEYLYASTISKLISLTRGIVENITVTPTVGNVAVQVTNLPAATSAEGTLLANLASLAIDYIVDGNFNNAIIGTITAGSANITNVSYNPALLNGATIASASTAAGVPASTTIVSYNPVTNTVVMSANATVTSVNLKLTVGGAIPSRITPTITGQNAQRISDAGTIVSAKISIQNGVTSYLDAGGGTAINIEMGGNRSMLANDFAMINDLGYAIVATNGGVTEQVSTFTYYCHTHYWANNGGQIRSVAGSNAHGNFGLRASGYDVTELPDAVKLADDMVQTAQVYKQGIVSGQMTPTVTRQALSIWILGYTYNPPNNSEIEIDHSAQGGAIFRYLISTVEHTTITVNGQNVLKLNLSTAGTNSTVTTGLQYPLYDGQMVTIRVNQNIKFNNIDNVKPTRPSTAVQYSENLGDIYRIIAYNLVESTGELLPSNIAILQSDASFNYYKLTTDGTNITQVDPGDPNKTQGSKVGDNKIAILQISQQSQIDQLNKGIFLTGWNGRVHRITGYTPPLFTATGAFNSYNNATLTLVVTNVAGSIDIGDIITGTGFTSGQTVTNVVLAGLGNLTATVTLSAIADTTPAGTITFGVSKNGYLSIDPNSVLNNSADGTGITSMNYFSKAAGPTGTTYTQVNVDVPFTTTLPVVDSYLTVANQATTAYNGTYQVLSVTSKTEISIANTSALSVGMVVASTAAGVYIPSTCVIQSIDSPTSFTVSPAAWIPAGTSIVSTLVAYMSGITISNPGTNYSIVPQITVSGGGALVQAIVTCTVASGSIQSVTIVSPGYGYSSTPTVTVSYGDAQLTPVLSESPQINSTVTSGIITTRLGLIYPNDPGVFTVGTVRTVSAFASITTGSSPYTVNLTINSGAVPTAGSWYQVSGNTNTLFNGFYKVAATGSSTTNIALIYNYNPGTWSGDTPTTVTLSVTNATSTQLGISKPFSASTAVTLRAGYPAESGAQVTTRISTCRVTGHDLLDIGTGSYNTTNWPTVIYGNPAKIYQQSQEILEEGVGRVFYVTTDQNGIFRVGRFFTVDQGTGSVTFSASIALSNLDGLGFKRGVVVSEFSTDPSMTNNASDTVPVMSAIRSYIDKRLGIDHGGSPVALANLIGSGFVPLNGTLAMKSTLNMGNFNIVNLGTPGTNYEAANKLYVDDQVVAYNAINKLTDVSIAVPSTNNILVYDQTDSKWKNKTVTGDVNLNFNTGTGVLSAVIQPSSIVNTQISPTAAILQSKLAMNIASTLITAPSGNAASIQSSNGLVSFNNNEFALFNGWASLRTSSSATTGVTLSKIQQISNGTLLGNRSGLAASPVEITPAQVVSDAGGLTNTLFNASGAITVAFDGVNVANNIYAVTGITTNRAVNSLVKTDSAGGIDVNYVKIGGYKALGITSLTNTFTTPGGFDYMNVIGTSSSNSTMTVFGTLDVSNGTLKTNLLTTDKSGAPSGPNAGSASINGWWAVQASSQIDFSLGTLKSLTLTTGGEAIAGTMTGRWTLAGASRLQATYADLAEYYEGDQDYEEGTVLVFGGDKEVTTTTQMNDTRSAGVVSANPAYVMNGEQTGIKVCIALAGRVPVKVIGRVKKGDMLTTSATAGYAVKALNPTLGAVIGKALEDKDYGEAGMIQVAVGRV